MANGNRTVNVPDHDPVQVPASLSPEEVRNVLVSSLGLTQVASASMDIAPNGDITFKRPVGGTKGL